MKTGHPDRSVCAAVDVHYLRTGGARAAVVLATDAVFAHVLAERIALVPRVAPYRPGEFYLRELPPVRAILDDLTGVVVLLVVDGYTDLDAGGRADLGDCGCSLPLQRVAPTCATLRQKRGVHKGLQSSSSGTALDFSMWARRARTARPLR